MLPEIFWLSFPFPLLPGSSTFFFFFLTMNQYCLECFKNMLTLAYLAALTMLSYTKIMYRGPEMIWRSKVKGKWLVLYHTGALRIRLHVGISLTPSRFLPLQHSVSSLSIKKMGLLAKNKLSEVECMPFLKSTMTCPFLKVGVVAITGRFFCSGSRSYHHALSDLLSSGTCWLLCLQVLISSSWPGQVLPSSLAYIRGDNTI